MNRRRVTLLFPDDLLGLVDGVSKRALGIGRNGFFCLSALLLCARLAPIVPLQKRQLLLQALEKEWAGLIEALRGSL